MGTVTPERVTVPELLASQAAISMENALLCADLQRENSERKRAEEELREREARIRRLGAELATRRVEAKRAEEQLLALQAVLAHATRVTTLGELSASIAHEVGQPLGAIVASGEACLRWPARTIASSHPHGRRQASNRHANVLDADRKEKMDCP